MKKILFTTAIIGFIFASCNKDNEEKEVKKLPSKFIYDSNVRILEYDNQNRLTKFTFSENVYQIFSYNSDGTLSKITRFIDGNEDHVNTFHYNGNQAFMFRGDSPDTALIFTINSNGELESYSFEEFDFEEEESLWWQITLTYNSNGNVTKLEFPVTETPEVRVFTYSDVKSIFRYVNMPDWFLLWFFEFEYSKNGYMVSQINFGGGDISNFTYTTDTNGYALTRTATIGEYTATKTFEYIFAK